MKQKATDKIKIAGDWIAYLLLFIYPLRHITWGLDLWDTGYNYANFQYMGQEHMDSMWLYSTYLANVVGNFLTKLPFAGSLVGMNFYTGLFVSALAVTGYWFCTRKLQIPAWIAFVGEMLAISLCWCPTALLYNYLTYVLFLVCVVLLYLGLTKKNNCYLFVAGICLGANVLARFSNLPEAALIVAVWVYAFIESAEAVRGKAKSLLLQTLWCLGGYLTALLVLFGYIHIRYGLDDYVAGILRLFAMTDNATDYKATSMIMGLVGTYIENLYWVIRIAVIVTAGVIGFAVLRICLESKRLTAWAEKSDGRKRFLTFVRHGAKGAWIAVSLLMLYWLYARQFCSMEFYSYGSMLRPGVLFLILTMGIAAVRIFHPKCPKEEKLISGLMILVVLLTSIGSNNGVYPSLNNLFIAAPYTLWQSWNFITKVKEWRYKSLVIEAFPAKTILVAFLAMCFFQFIGFGANFVFVEATGAQQVTAQVENNEILKGVKMHPDRARWMTEISAYVNENDLQGREVILYGELPALSFYLQMPSAFNPWSDLRSYSLETMEQAMKETADALAADPEKRPVVIVEKRYAEYFENGLVAFEADLNALALPEQQTKLQMAYEKWQLIESFMIEYGYGKVFSNEKFTIYE